MIFIFSVAVALTFCPCCCNPKVNNHQQQNILWKRIRLNKFILNIIIILILSQSRQAMVNYVNSDLPVNHIVLTSQLESSDLAQSFSSALYVQQSAPLRNCGPVPSAPQPNYSAVPRTPPPPYSQVSAAHARNYGPNPSTPPPAYEVLWTFFSRVGYSELVCIWNWFQVSKNCGFVKECTFQLCFRNASHTKPRNVDISHIQCCSMYIYILYIYTQ